MFLLKWFPDSSILVSSHCRCRWYTRSPCLSISGRLAHGFGRPLIHTLRQTHISEHTYTGRSDIALFLIERLCTVTDGAAGIRGCVLIIWRAAKRRAAPMNTRPRQILNTHINIIIPYQCTKLYKRVVCLDTLHWQVKQGSSVANTSLPIRLAVQLLRGSEIQTTTIKQ